MSSSVDASRIRKILIVQFRPFGDVLLATTHLPALKKAFPAASIDFFVFKPFDMVLRNNPFVSTVISFRPVTTPAFMFHWGRQLFKIWWRRYDLVIDQQAGTGSAEIIAASFARYRLGWRNARYAWLYNLKAEGVPGRPRYQAFHNLNIVRPLGIDPVTPGLFYHIDEQSTATARTWLESEMDGRTVVICSPGTNVPRRQWSLERWGETARNLAIEGYGVCILWAPREHADARRVVEIAAHAGVRLAPPTTLNEAAAFVKQSALLMCNDCGLNHVSVAVRARSLSIHSVTRPDVWSAQGCIEGHYALYNPAQRDEAANGFGISARQATETALQILRSSCG